MSDVDVIETLKIEEKEALHGNNGTGTAVRPAKYENNWIAGVVLIAIGIILLFANLTDFYLDNWWALFILIPAVSGVVNGWRDYQRDGRFTKDVRSSFLWSIVFTLIAATFLFNLNWDHIWPFFLIIAGIGAVWGSWADRS